MMLFKPAPRATFNASTTSGRGGSWLVDGWIDIRRLSNLIGIDLVDEAGRYSTLAGYILWRLGHLPKADERVVAVNLAFEEGASSVAGDYRMSCGS